ncbi:DNA-binding protein [Cupriavidus sp. UYMSc13B]|nr:DNA-binding protein [Cupriavidus sp. UYMSc13B]
MVAKKLYLLDANVLITAHREYYPIDMVPEFWDWLLHMAQAGIIKMPLETYEEVKDGGGKVKKDALVDWLGQDEVKDALVLDEEVHPPSVDKVVATYATDLNDTEIEQLGRDPFLIAHALTDPNSRIVVSIEVSAPGKKRANRRVPDVCKDNGVQCCNTFAMLRTLKFSTSWQL